LILADTGAVVALVDADDRHHEELREVWEADPAAWVLPWAILPEVDYLLASQLGAAAEEAFLADVADGAFRVAWGDERDLAAARRIAQRHRSLRLGLVDAVVIAMAERLGAAAIATLDLRHFGAVKIKGSPRLYPRDL
jgi:uncharacterized protein